MGQDAALFANDQKSARSRMRYPLEARCKRESSECIPASESEVGAVASSDFERDIDSSRS